MVPPLVVHLVNMCYLIYIDNSGMVPRGYKTIDKMIENAQKSFKGKTQQTVIMRGFRDYSVKDEVVDALSNLSEVATIRIEKVD